MNKRKILVIPAASCKECYHYQIPKIFAINNYGRMNIIQNMMGLPLDDFDKIYITINKDIDNLYKIYDMLSIQLELIDIKEKTEIIIIEKTKNVVQTILNTIEYIPFKDFGLFVKDADAHFNISELSNENTVYTYLLEDVDKINPSSKSYVSTTSDDVILNIIEKRVISSEFCAGGYYFNSSNDFIDLCSNISEYDKLYLSNVIFYDILHNNEMYRTEQVQAFTE